MINKEKQGKDNQNERRAQGKWEIHRKKTKETSKQNEGEKQNENKKHTKNPPPGP